MKTRKEFSAPKEEAETLNEKINELTNEELEQVTGGKPVTVGDFRADKGAWYCTACDKITTPDAEAKENGYKCKDCGKEFSVFKW
ncbi:MAG: bacteriocin [Clostridia bacterium]|nr:bacteriocin [Clostridia bacterium]